MSVSDIGVLSVIIGLLWFPLLFRGFASVRSDNRTVTQCGVRRYAKTAHEMTASIRYPKSEYGLKDFGEYTHNRISCSLAVP